MIDEDPAPFIRVPCCKCDGEGTIEYRTLGIDYVHGGMIETWRTCDLCGGDGIELIEGESVTEDEIMEPV